MMRKINENIPEILRKYHIIAVVGLSDKPHRPSHGVAKKQLLEGYEVIPVNPNCREVFGRKSYSSLLEVPGEVELVNIFRRPEFVAGVVDQAIEKGARAIWMQLGVIDTAAAEKALAAGLQVVMDRCWAIEYRKLASG